MTKTEKLFLEKAIKELKNIDEDRLNDENWFSYRKSLDILYGILEGKDK